MLITLKLRYIFERYYKNIDPFQQSGIRIIAKQETKENVMEICCKESSDSMCDKILQIIFLQSSINRNETTYLHFKAPLN